jgi:hypothetical protein
MTHSNQQGSNALREGQELYHEFEGRLKALAARGLVDCKMKLVVGQETTPGGVVRILNNVLRLIEAKEARPLTLA